MGFPFLGDRSAAAIRRHGVVARVGVRTRTCIPRPAERTEAVAGREPITNRGDGETWTKGQTMRKLLITLGLRTDEDGQTFVEYAVLLGAVSAAIAVSVMWAGLGVSLGTALTQVSNAITGA
jgi:Flp pilus assembly pilin Flp